MGVLRIVLERKYFDFLELKSVPETYDLYFFFNKEKRIFY